MFCSQESSFHLAFVLCTVISISCASPSSGEIPSGDPGNGNQRETLTSTGESLSPKETSTENNQQVSTAPLEPTDSRISTVTQAKNGRQETVHISELDGVKEYADWCGKQERTKDGMFESIATWGEATETFKQWHSDYEAVEPPPEIKRYHAAQTMAFSHHVHRCKGRSLERTI